MSARSVQQCYPENYQHCYGCGPLNEHGLHIATYVEGDDCVCVFEPKQYHTAFPKYVYGGLIASIIDCHSMGTAAAATAAQDGVDIQSDAAKRFVTAQLNITFLNPTPIGVPLEVRARATEIKDRKVVIEASLRADGVECATGYVVAVLIPDGLIPE